MVVLAVPEAARERLKALHAAYLLSKRDLFCYTEGLLLGMGLSPEDCELDTGKMTVSSPGSPLVRSQELQNKVNGHATPY